MPSASAGGNQARQGRGDGAAECRARSRAQRDEEAKRLKTAEAARLAAEQAKRLKDEEARQREAARQRDEEAKRLQAETPPARPPSAKPRASVRKRPSASGCREAERKKADARPCGGARRGAAGEGRRSQPPAVERGVPARRGPADLAARLGGPGLGARRLKRLEQDTTCDHVRQDVTALLAQPPIDATRRLSASPSDAVAAPEPAPVKKPEPSAAPSTPQVAALTPPAAKAPAAVNTREQVIAAQTELQRLGCFAGRQDGSLGNATKEAVQRYLSQKGRSANDVSITDDLVTSLKGEAERVCPLTCSRGEHPEGDRCIANAKPDKPEKSEKPKATARQSDEDEPRRGRSKREERREARPKPERSERAASRPVVVPQIQIPAARSQAAAPGRPSGMIGVGFRRIGYRVQPEPV